MGIELPAALDPYLAIHGIYFPEGDETACFDYGSSWVGMGSTLMSFAEEARSTSASLASANHGQAVDAFTNEFNGDASGGVVPITSTMGMGYSLIGGAMYIMGAAILGFKIAAIVQLIIQMISELTAIAEAPVTFGASLLQIPPLRLLIKSLLDQLLDMAIQQVLEG